jgi:hypothetical protein
VVGRAVAIAGKQASRRSAGDAPLSAPAPHSVRDGEELRRELVEIFERPSRVGCSNDVSRTTWTTPSSSYQAAPVPAACPRPSGSTYDRDDFGDGGWVGRLALAVLGGGRPA